VIGDRRARGFRAAAVLRAWDREEAALFPPPAQEGVTEPSLFDDLEPEPQITLRARHAA
jgi:hypothetical protein